MSTQQISSTTSETQAPASYNIRQAIEDHLPLVRKIARKTYRRFQGKFELDDLEGYGNLGLTIAAQRFDIRRAVPFDKFADDLDKKPIPNFVWISPDQCHDMHGLSSANATAVGIPDCASPSSGLDHKVIALGDAFLKSTVKTIMHSRAWREDSAIVIAWDEDDYAGFKRYTKSIVTFRAARRALFEALD